MIQKHRKNRKIEYQKCVLFLNYKQTQTIKVTINGQHESIYPIPEY